MDIASPVDFEEVTKIQERAVSEALSALETDNVVLIEAPTGAGKTRINARIIEELEKRFDKSLRALNLSHRDRLTDQSEKAFHQWAPKSALSTSIASDGNFDQSGDNVYALVQTVAARLDQIDKYDFAGIDEAHHASDAKSGDYATVLPKLVADNPNIKLVFVTATPTRPDKKGLTPLLQNAPRVTIGWAELERAGQIKLPRTIELRVTSKDGGTVNAVAAKHYKPEKDANSEGLTKAIRNARAATFHEEMADAWERHAEGLRTIAYESSIKGARDFAAEMSSRGHRVDVVDSQAGRDHNIDVLNRYERGELDMVISVKMIDEGLDVPATRAVLILRETTSEIEYRQMVGRTIRMGSDPAYWDVQPVVLDGGASTMIHGSIESQAAVIDYLQKLERGEISQSSLSERAGKTHDGEYTPWRTVKAEPRVHAMSDGEAVIFALERPDIQGNPRYSLIEASPDKNGMKLHIMRDDNNKPLNGIDGTALHRVESERLIAARSALLRLEATKTRSGDTLMQERIAAAADKHLNSMIAFVAMQNQNYAR
jgi:superfamily II DNA or RNA helicase